MNLRHSRTTPILLVALDLLSVFVVFNVVIYARGVSLPVVTWPLAGPAIVLILSLHLIDGYRAKVDRLNLDYASLHLIATFFAAFALLLVTFAFASHTSELKSSRAVLLISMGLLGPITLAYRRLIYLRSLDTHSERTLLFVGTREEFEAFKVECQKMHTETFLMHVSTEGGFREFEEVIESASRRELTLEAIVIRESPKSMPQEIPMKLVQLHFDGIPTYSLEIFHQAYWRKIPAYRINPTWLFQDGFRVARDPVFERCKRISDILFSSLGLILSAVVIVPAAIAIKIEDGGPVFFSQIRIGRNRTPFRLLKLRTMRESGETGDLYTQKEDARVTKVGRLLRSTRLDEFPQLWNVLKGDMSLIGPRAEWDKLVEKYEHEIPCYHFRHLVKPGITGWAQVNYPYGGSVEDTVRKLEYDLYYIRNFSFVIDASIILKMLHVMIFRKRL